MITLKDDTVQWPDHPMMVLALQVIRACLPSAYDYLVITSGREPHSRHGYNSRHYAGQAVDIRTRHLNDQEKNDFADLVRSALGSDFDVVLEETHLHVEYDPKRRDAEGRVG